MRICHVTSMHGRDDDRIYQRACLGLARAGHEVVLVATEGAGIMDSDITVVPVKKRSGLRRRVFSSIEAVLKARRLSADIYHFHDPDLLPWAPLLKRDGAVVIYDVHENYVSRAVKLPPPIRGVAGRLIRGFEKLIIRRISGYTAVTETMAGLFADTGAPYAVIRNTVDVSRLEGLELPEPDETAPPVIYTSGTNAPARNCAEMVRVLPLVLERFPKVRMMFAGRYSPGYQEELRRTAEEMGVGHALDLEGMLPWEENFIRTAGAFCGCVLYERNENNLVTIPNRLFEYMYCGIPVVAEDLPELRKIMDAVGCGILVDSRDPEALAEGFCYLLEDPARAREMGRRGRRAIEEEWGYQEDVRNTLDLYERLLRRMSKEVAV